MNEITSLLGVPAVKWENYIEWRLPETTVERLTDTIKKRLKQLGASFYNVDSTNPPYYFVAVRCRNRL